MGKKENYIKSGARRRHQEKKREEAIERQEKRNNRTPLEQMQLIANRRGESKRESNKLLALVA